MESRTENLLNINSGSKLVYDGGHEEEVSIIGDIFNQTKHTLKSEIEKPEQITVCFDNIEDLLVETIHRHDIVVGCVAWLTNENILKALARKEAVQIVIQAEDFLRPDSQQTTAKLLRKLYEKLPNFKKIGGFDNRVHINNSEFPNVSMLSDHVNCNTHNCDQVNPDAITMIGRMRKNSRENIPRMHHKFLVFPGNDKEDSKVWTGSFNLTKNATNSRENGLLIEGGLAPVVYYQEWERMFMISDKIPTALWGSKWHPVEHRIGT